MLQVKDSKNIVKPLNNDSQEKFDIKMLESFDGTRTFAVEVDLINHVVALSINVNDYSFQIILSAEQACSVGNWLSEAGYVVNFIEKANIQIEETVEDPIMDEKEL